MASLASDKHGGADAEWRMCADWLLRCLSSSPDIHAQAQSVLVDTPGATVVDLLNCLTDGVLLCHILPALSCQQVTPDQLPGFKMATLNSQFAFRRNLSLFLSACQNEFGLAPGDLFSTDDLLSQENVGSIIRTLSLLSNSHRARQSGIDGFTVASSNGAGGVSVDFSSDYCNLMATATAKKSQQQQQQQQQQQLLAVPTAEQPPGGGGNYIDAAAERVYETIMNRTHERASSEASARKSVKEICMEELVTTERTYVDTLRLLVEDVMRPMKESQSSWTPVEVDAIFEHLPELLSLHRKLLRELEVATQLRGAKPLPAVLISFHDQLLLYGSYCAHMTEAISLLDDACRSDRKRQDELQRHLTAAKAQFKLTEYLAVPMQRVLRYHLLVKSLMDYDRKEGGQDKDLLKAAHDAMCDVATYVNETKRDTEMRVLINQIQTQMAPLADFSLGRKSRSFRKPSLRSISSLDMPGQLRLTDYGRLERDDDLRVANDPTKPSGGSKLRFCFLWTRMFMLAKPRPSLTFKAAFAIKPNLQIRELDLSSQGSGQSSSSAAAPAGSKSTTASTLSTDAKWTWAFTVSEQSSATSSSSAKDQPERVNYLFLAKTRDARARWLEAFQRAKDDVAPANFSANGYYFERRTLDAPAICTVCHKLIHGCFFQGYKCRKSGHTVHKQCIPSMPIAPPSLNSHGAAAGARPQSLISPAPPRSPVPGAQVVRRDTISYVAPMPSTAPLTPQPPPALDTGSSPRSPISPAAAASSRGVSVVATAGPPAWTDCYAGVMNRDDARDALMPRPAGTFLVRESQGNGEYAVSLRHSDTVKHMRVLRSTEGYRLGETRNFATVPELIAYYCSNSLRECFRELDCRLETPFKLQQQQQTIRQSTLHKPSGGVLGWAPVIRDYSAPPSAGHVSLSVGEIVAVLSQDGSLWSGRKLNGQVGLFPAESVGALSASPIE